MNPPNKLDKILDKLQEIAVTISVFNQRVTFLEEKMEAIEKKVDDNTKFSWTIRIGGSVAFILAGAALACVVWLLEVSLDIVMRLNAH